MSAGILERGQRFPSTHWTHVYLASAHEQDAGSRALAELLAKYRPALIQYLAGRYAGVDRAELEDWISAFIHQKILLQHLLRHAHHDKGRFRNYLLTALYRFAEDQRRRSVRGKRLPAGGLVPIDANHSSIEFTTNSPPSEGDRQWAVAVIAEARDRTESFYSTKGRQDTWSVFAEGCFLPLYHGHARPSDQELAERHGFESARQVANAIISAKRRFGHILREVVRTYESSDQLVDGEIRDLIALVSQGDGPSSVSPERKKQ